MVAGKVLMDRNAPAYLLDTAESGYSESRDLIERWHGKGRQLYCITPRFAASSTEAQLEAAGRLWADNPGTFLQTHLCESTAEIEWVKSLFPDRRSYLDVYRGAGLAGRRAIFGHAIYMTEQDFRCCYDTGSALGHCPTSNLFLGSGLFRAFDAKRTDRPVRLGIGTDIGAGTSLCHLQTLGEAYKTAALNDTKLSSIHAFYLATRGGAEALYLDDRIGSLAPGYEADMVVLDPAATPLLDFRMQHANGVTETLFLLMTLGDDRVIRATYVAGHPVYDRDRVEPFSYPALS
jgi:guanine deaminase